jgi:hypothetical protein
VRIGIKEDYQVETVRLFCKEDIDLCIGNVGQPNQSQGEISNGRDHSRDESYRDSKNQDRVKKSNKKPKDLDRSRNQGKF